jgi:hypothetical protein
MSEKKMGKQNEKWNEVEGGAQGEILEAFLSSASDGYAILQLNQENEDTRDMRFMSLDFIERMHGEAPQMDLYDVMYAGTLNTASKDPAIICENLYQKFNIDRPEDFRGHSLSVSDVVALKQQGIVNYYFVDSFGFKELPGFDSGRNPLRGIEDQIEQNDNQLDGIINNMPEETVAEKEAKTSVVEKLKAPVPEHEKKPKSQCPCMER